MPEIGIFGGGQLGRMLALAGSPLGYNFGFFTAQENPPASNLGRIFGEKNNENALADFADFADIITFENENINIEIVKKIAHKAQIYPNIEALAATQNRISEKQLLTKSNIPSAPYHAVHSFSELQEAAETIGLPAVLKSARDGYDGRGQTFIDDENQLKTAWEKIRNTAILERRINFERELSLVSVRDKNHNIHHYPLVENRHHRGILRLTLAPAKRSENLQKIAETHMQTLLEKMDYVGILAVEFFEKNNDLMVNEIAPRVHNSAHWTMDAAAVSQFENHIRAIVGQPPGATTAIFAHAAMVNIIGRHGDISAVLKLENAHLHLYQKSERPNRKLGHINITADTEENLKKTLRALKNFLPEDENFDF